MAVPTPQDVIPLAQEITRLQAQLADAQRRWSLLFGSGEGEKKPRPASALSLTGRILTFISEHPGVQYSINTVSQAVEEAELPVGRALYRLAMTGKISNPRRGIYTALESEDQNKTPA